ncbi:hypothetical protein Trydic_g987 [Trypoxylus dichotomus]
MPRPPTKPVDVLRRLLPEEPVMLRGSSIACRQNAGRRSICNFIGTTFRKLFGRNREAAECHTACEAPPWFLTQMTYFQSKPVHSCRRKDNVRQIENVKLKFHSSDNIPNV